jgi:hypothetical protein
MSTPRQAIWVMLTDYAGPTGGNAGQYSWTQVFQQANFSFATGPGGLSGSPADGNPVYDPNQTYDPPPVGGIIDNNQIPLGTIIYAIPSPSGPGYLLQDSTVPGTQLPALAGITQSYTTCETGATSHVWAFSGGFLASVT